ncbi:NAD(P)-dependent oxidoreductase [Chloroflexota bacterium]
MGKAIFHMGDVGCGNTTKLINNYISSGCSSVTYEAIVLGAKAGIDVQTLQEVLRNGTADNYCIRATLPKIFAGDFEPGFTINLAAKDIGLAIAMAKEYGVPTPIGAAVEQQQLAVKASGWGEKGAQARILLVEKLAGVEVRAPKK